MTSPTSCAANWPGSPVPERRSAGAAQHAALRQARGLPALRPRGAQAARDAPAAGDALPARHVEDGPRHGRIYSVPNQLVSKAVEIRATTATIEILQPGASPATPARRRRRAPPRPPFRARWRVRRAQHAARQRAIPTSRGSRSSRDPRWSWQGCRLRPPIARVSGCPPRPPSCRPSSGHLRSALACDQCVARSRATIGTTPLATRGALRVAPHCGDAWRPRRGPLDGPFTCRLRATRQVEGGVWLLVGGGPRRDLGAARRLP
jgi:hypothetical protein